MGDRFLLVRLAADAVGRRAAGLQPMRDVNREATMRDESPGTLATRRGGSKLAAQRGHLSRQRPAGDLPGVTAHANGGKQHH